MISPLSALRAMAIKKQSEVANVCNRSRRDFTSRELEVFAVSSIRYIHAFPPNGDTKAAQERLGMYSALVKDCRDFILRK